MTVPQPLPNQQTLRLDRGQQLTALRSLKTGDAFAKSILRAIDDHIGDGRNGFAWRVSVNELADECDMSRSEAYRSIRLLNDIGYIRWTAKKGSPAVFTIVWQRIFDAVEEQKKCPSDTSRSAHQAQRSAHQALQSAQWALPNILKKRPLSAPEAPPPNPQGGTVVVEDLCQKLTACGVLTAPQTIRDALELRTIEALTAIVEHYLAEFTLPAGPPPWDQAPGYLVWRLTNPDFASAGPSEGWKEPSAAFKARKAARSQPEASGDESASLSKSQAERRERIRQLEARHAARFDALNREQLLALASRAPGPEAPILTQAVRNGFAPSCRAMFLEILDREAKPP